MSDIRLLVVEDDPLIRRALVRFFRGRGYVVTAAGSCALGILCLRTSPLYHVVISDYDLGDGTGEDVLQAAEVVDSRTLRILHTASNAEPEIAHYVVRKGTTLETLARIVEQG